MMVLMSIYVLHTLYITSTETLHYLYRNSTIVLRWMNRRMRITGRGEDFLFPYWEQNIPSLGMKCSHTGNIYGAVGVVFEAASDSS